MDLGRGGLLPTKQAERVALTLGLEEQMAKESRAILGRRKSTSRVLDTEKQKKHEEQQDVQSDGSLTGSRTGRRRAGRTVKCQIIEAFESQIKDLIFSLGNHRNFLRKE